MKKRLFEGCGVAIVTPMNDDMSVNFDKLGELIEFHIENNTDALIVCGTTGESPTLSDEEHRKVIEYSVKKVNKRIPVIAGSGSNDTNYCIHLSQEAEKMGVDGLLLVTPYYNKASQKGLVKHYLTVADSVNIPMILYSVASRTGVNITPKACYELSKHKNIVAIKEASGNISQVAEIKQLCGDNLDIYSGNDDQAVPIMSLGGLGVISVIANIMPKEMHLLCKNYLSGDTKGGLELQMKLLQFMNSLFIDVNPIMIKHAMNLKGMNVGECRLPLCATSDENLATLKIHMQNLGLI